jgi:hypothetical protein
MSVEFTALSDARDRRKAQRSIGILRASGIDGILPLNYLIRLCHGLPVGTEADADKESLIAYGLLQSDGSVSNPVRSAVCA